MKYTVIHDCPDSQGEDILNYLRERTAGRSEFSFLSLTGEVPEPCCGCFNCWTRSPGICVYNDRYTEILKEDINSDRVLYLGPITWGAWSPGLKIYLDRSIGRVLPFLVSHKGETHHPSRYSRNPELFLAGYTENTDSGEEALFRECTEGMNDNLNKGETNTVVIRTDRDFSLLDRFLEGEEK